MNTKNVEANKWLTTLNKGPLTFGQMIQALRKCDEIPQVKLAKKVKISRAYLCDIEKGRKLVGFALAGRLAKVMGYSQEQFVSIALKDQLRKEGLNMKIELKAA